MQNPQVWSSTSVLLLILLQKVTSSDGLRYVILGVKPAFLKLKLNTTACIYAAIAVAMLIPSLKAPCQNATSVTSECSLIKGYFTMQGRLALPGLKLHDLVSHAEIQILWLCSFPLPMSRGKKHSIDFCLLWWQVHYIGSGTFLLVLNLCASNSQAAIQYS